MKEHLRTKKIVYKVNTVGIVADAHGPKDQAITGITNLFSQFHN